MQKPAHVFHGYNWVILILAASTVKRPTLHQRAKIQDRPNCTTKKLKPGLVAFYNIQPGNGVGLFLKEKISRGEISNKKVKKNG